MEFASSHVYYYDHSDEEFVSDDEYDDGITLSSDDEEEKPRTTRAGSLKGFSRISPQACKSEKKNKEKRNSLGESLRNKLGGLFGASTSDAASAKPAPKPKKKRHWQLEDEAVHCNAGNENKLLWRDRAWRRADTNVVSILLNKLVAPSNMHTGDMVRCSHCKGIMSHLSKLQDQGDTKEWQCDFCGVNNTVDVFEEEIPKTEDVTYMLSPAPSTAASSTSGIDNSLVVFCMDISGSMCVTTEVAGRLALRGERLSELQKLNDTGESQWLPGQHRNVTFVSRLQSTQAAVDHQLEVMAKEHPNRRVALVTFNSQVTVYGDGKQEIKVFSGDKLNDKEQMIGCASELVVPDAIKNTRQTLGKTVFELEEKGQTALGPALLLSVMLASKHPASKVIVCTDGRANIGLGSLDTGTDEGAAAATTFYTDVANLAKERGVSVSVVTIEGTDCKLVELGRVADITEGQVNIVQPQNLTKEFGNILANPVIATNVSAVFTVHKNLYIRNVEEHQNWTEKTVGNVNADTEITFEFGVRQSRKRKSPEKKGKVLPEVVEEGSLPSKPEGQPSDEPSCSSGTGEKAAAAEGATAAQGATAKGATASHQPTELPFQIQVMYTDLEGAKAMRVLTQSKPVTKDRDEAEKNMNLAVLGTHTNQRSATYAVQGDFKSSRLNAMMTSRLVERQRAKSDSASVKKRYGNFKKYLSPLEQTSRASEREQSERDMADDVYLCVYEAKHSSTRTYLDDIVLPSVSGEDVKPADDKDGKDKKEKKDEKE